MAKNEPLTAEQLAAIKARADAATTGPWVDKLRDFEGVDGYGLESHPTVEANGKTVCIFYEREIDDDNDEADATFIASAREDIPALLAEVERLRTDVARLRARLRWLSKCAFKDTNRCAKLPGFSRCVWNCGEWCGAADDLRKGCWREFAGMATRENPGESG